jgi:hypothetical protein
MEEIWKDIPGFYGYQASNLGRIKSLKRAKERFIGSKTKMANGYVRCHTQINNNTYNIGRLILTAFIRPANNGEECDHIDRNPENNNLSNLRWVSRTENLLNRGNYGKGKLKGVSYCGSYYKLKDGTVKFNNVIRAQITINGKRMSLGNYKTEEAAHEAYKQAYLNHYGYEWMG